MKKILLVCLLGLVGFGMSPKANAWSLWWTWHYTFYGSHGTKTLLNGVMIAGYDAPGGACNVEHTLNGGLVFHDTGQFCSDLKIDIYEVQLCDGGHPPANCQTIARFTKDAVWRSSTCAPCNDFNANCGSSGNPTDYPVGVLNVPCFESD